MKTLLLMRHAEASWERPGLTDHERPLHKRGRKDAKLIAKVMDANHLFPNLILSSTARRAVETVEILAENLGYTNEIIYSDALYMAEPDDFIGTLQKLGDEIDNVLIVAHNPGLETFLQIIVGEIAPMPTGTLGHLVLNLEGWREISFDTMGKLADCWTPKTLV